MLLCECFMSPGLGPWLVFLARKHVLQQGPGYIYKYVCMHVCMYAYTLVAAYW